MFYSRDDKLVIPADYMAYPYNPNVPYNKLIRTKEPSINEPYSYRTTAH